MSFYIYETQYKKGVNEMTETNAERLERLKDINDTKYIVALNNPTDDGCSPDAINFEREVDWLIEQAEQVQEIKNKEYRMELIDEHIERLEKENKHLREEVQSYQMKYENSGSVFSRQNQQTLIDENKKFREALLRIAHGDTHTAYPHDIAKWALEGVSDDQVNQT